jgi:hypothetical protein
MDEIVTAVRWIVGWKGNALSRPFKSIAVNAIIMDLSAVGTHIISPCPLPRDYHSIWIRREWRIYEMATKFYDLTPIFKLLVNGC